MQTPTSRDPRASLSRWRRAHSPLNVPRFSRRHSLLALAILALLILTSLAPGLLADLNGLRVGDWQMNVMCATGVLLLHVWALLGVRAMHGSMLVVHFMTVVALSLKLSSVRIGQDYLSGGFTLLLVMLAVLAARTIVRPNETERLAALQQQVDERSRPSPS